MAIPTTLDRTDEKKMRPLTLAATAGSAVPDSGDKVLPDPSAVLAQPAQLAGQNGTGQRLGAISNPAGGAILYRGGRSPAIPQRDTSLPALLPNQGQNGMTAAEVIAAGGPEAVPVTGTKTPDARQPLPDPSTVLATYPSRVDTDALNRTAPLPTPTPVNYAYAGSDPALVRATSGGWAGRDAIRGGAAPSTLDQGSGLSGVRGQFIPAGVGGTPGTQINSDYGYGDVVTATADKNGRFTQFSGVGGGGSGKPSLADYSAGLARAAADKEALAKIEDERNAIAPYIAPAAGQGARGDESLAGGGAGGRGDARLGAAVDPATAARAAGEVATANANAAATRAATRGRAQANIDAAAAAPYVLQELGSKIGQTNAVTGEALARAGQIGTQTDAAKVQLQAQKDMEGLRQKAIASGKPEDMERYSQAVRASAGKGGNLTQEDIGNIWKEYLVAHTKAFAMAPNAPEAMGFQEFQSQLTGKGQSGPPRGVPEGSIAEYAGQKKVYKNGQWVDFK